MQLPLSIFVRVTLMMMASIFPSQWIPSLVYTSPVCHVWRYQKGEPRPGGVATGRTASPIWRGRGSVCRAARVFVRHSATKKHVIVRSILVHHSPGRSNNSKQIVFSYSRYYIVLVLLLLHWITHTVTIAFPSPPSSPSPTPSYEGHMCQGVLSKRL